MDPIKSFCWHSYHNFPVYLAISLNIIKGFNFSIFGAYLVVFRAICSSVLRRDDPHWCWGLQLGLASQKASVLLIPVLSLLPP